MRQFYLYQRNKTYYCRFKCSETGKWLSGISTGETDETAAMATVYGWEKSGMPSRGGRSVSSFVSARSIIEQLKTVDLTSAEISQIVNVLRTRGLIVSAVIGDSPSSEPLIDYLERFWDYERSEYVRHKKAYKHRISKKHCYTMANHVSRWWKPFFEDVLLGEVTSGVLNEFALSLSGKLAESSINHVLRAGITALGWAKKKEYIAVDPTADVDPFPENPKKRDVLTSEEARQLFALDWPDEIAKLASLVAMTTGARAGEVVALRVEDIEEDRLHIRHSWSERDGMGPPKNGDTRTVPLLPEIRDQLRYLARFNPHTTSGESFVFWSSLRSDRPRDSKAFNQGLSDALLLLSVSRATLEAGKRGERARRNGKSPKPEDLEAADTVAALRKEWRDRGISFHSWRHYFATRMADRVNMRTLQLATGHKTEAMAKHYSNHADPVYFTAVAQAGVDAFSGVVAQLKSSA